VPVYSSECAQQYQQEHGDTTNDPVQCAKAYGDVVRKLAIENNVKRRLSKLVKKYEHKAEFVERELPRQIEVA